MFPLLLGIVLVLLSAVNTKPSERTYFNGCGINLELEEVFKRRVALLTEGTLLQTRPQQDLTPSEIHPWVVSFGTEGYKGEWKHVCGGSIISPYFILTTHQTCRPRRADSGRRQWPQHLCPRLYQRPGGKSFQSFCSPIKGWKKQLGILRRCRACSRSSAQFHQLCAPHLPAQTTQTWQRLPECWGHHCGWLRRVKSWEPLECQSDR